MADASFHLVTNLPQVTSWLTLLTADSKKRKGLAFRAVEPMLAVVRDMLARAPERRPPAEEVEARFAHTIRQLEGIIVAHCKQAPSSPTAIATNAKRSAIMQSAPVDMPLPPSPTVPQIEFNNRHARPKARRQEILDDEDLVDPNHPSRFPDPSEKRAKPKDQQKALRRLDASGYDFDFGFLRQQQRQHGQHRDDQSPTSTESSATPPPSSGGNSYSSLHQQEQMMLGMRQTHRRHQEQARRQQNRDQKYVLKDYGRASKRKKDTSTIDETILQLRKALEAKLDQEYGDDDDSDSDDDDDDDDDQDHDSNDDDDGATRRRLKRDERRRYLDDLAMSLSRTNLNLPRYEA